MLPGAASSPARRATRRRPSARHALLRDAATRPRPRGAGQVAPAACRLARRDRRDGPGLGRRGGRAALRSVAGSCSRLRARRRRSGRWARFAPLRANGSSGRPTSPGRSRRGRPPPLWAARAVELTPEDARSNGRAACSLYGEATASAAGVGVACRSCARPSRAASAEHADGDPRARASVAAAGWAIGRLLHEQTFFDASAALADELVGELGEPADAGSACCSSSRGGGALSARDDYEGARRDLRPALAIAQATGDETLELEANVCTPQAEVRGQRQRSDAVGQAGSGRTRSAAAWTSSRKRSTSVRRSSWTMIPRRRCR